VPYPQILPSARLSKKSNLRIREVPEWQAAVIYDPDQLDLRIINLTSRLILELCDGRSMKQIEEHYCTLLRDQVDSQTAREQFNDGLSQLQEHKLATVSI